MALLACPQMRNMHTLADRVVATPADPRAVAELLMVMASSYFRRFKCALNTLADLVDVTPLETSLHRRLVDDHGVLHVVPGVGYYRG